LLMVKLLVGTFFLFLSATLCAQSQSGSNRSTNILLASGAVYWAHCDKRCEELRCPNRDACYKACVENKGTVLMCPKVEQPGK
jgi:hypothetical protein